MKFSHILEQSPRDWETTMHQNLVLKIFILFMTFSPGLETNDTLQCSSDSFPHMVTYILCVENCEKLHFDAWLSPNHGETVLECEKMLWTQDLRVQHMYDGMYYTSSHISGKGVQFLILLHCLC